MSDLRLAARMLAKNPAFTLIAALLLALGIGAGTAIFTAADAVLLRPLQVRHPEQLVRLVQKTPQLGTRSYYPWPVYEALRDHSRSLSAVFGELEIEAAMNEPAPAEQVRVDMVTPEFFDVLGIPALYGRTLTPADANETPGMPPAVLSYSFWRKRFNGDAQAIGRAIVLNRHKFFIAGVMPRNFNGISVDTAPDLRVPVRVHALLGRPGPLSKSEYADFGLAARLRPAVTLPQARAECYSIWRSTIETYYRANPEMARFTTFEISRGLELDPLEHGLSILRDRFGGALKLLLAFAGLLLLMVCANIGGLLLARGASRRDEIAVRLAVGASRSRLVRQMMAESFLLSAIGALTGIGLAFAATPLLVGALPPMRDLATVPLTLTLDPTPDRRVLLFSLAVSVAAAFLFGLAPAFTASRLNLDTVLRGARSSGGWRGRQGIVIFQIALCTLLLAGASLLVRSFEALRQTAAGFDRDHVVTFSADTSLAGYTIAQAKALRAALIERVRDLPGVIAAATASRPLMRGSGMKMTIAPTGQRASRADFLNTSTNAVSPEYFDTMGMHIVAGRSLPADDDPKLKPRNVVVNEAFVRRFFPNVNPLGQRFGSGMETVAGADFAIIGVVTDAKYRSLREPMTPTIYTRLTDPDAFQLIVRTRGNPAAVIQPVREALAALDPALPFTEVHTLADDVSASTAGERLTAALASFFGAFAGLLAAVGIYGLLSYAVAQRRREIGIRMALGARPSGIAVMVGRSALLMTAGGIGIGLAASLLAGRWLQSLLYGIRPSDTASLAVAAGFLIVVAAVATAFPVRRATRVEPAATLRQEN